MESVSMKRQRNNPCFAIPIEQAAVMLQNSRFSIEEVCSAVGYSDISRFYRNFKEQYGMTSAQFRQINVI